MKVCLDSNVLVSAFATRGIASDVVRLTLAEHELIVPEVVLAEVLRVLEKKIRVSAELLEAVEEPLRRQTLIPKPRNTGRVSIRDADDAWVVASAVAGMADLLVTGDADILALGKAAPLPVLTTRAFWERVTGKSGGAVSDQAGY